MKLLTARGTIDEVLIAVSDFDNDFIGENGYDYLWESAEGFDSNRDYVLDLVKDLDPEEKVKAFLHRWMGYDLYYLCYDYHLEKVSENDYVLSVAFDTYE